MSDGKGRLARGHEGELFEKYNVRLLRATARVVHGSRDVIDEACAFAWAHLMTHDVRLETAFAWLREVARNEALRLLAIDRALVPLGDERGTINPEYLEVPSGNPMVTPERWTEALARLDRLPELERRMVAMRAFGWRYEDIGRELGISRTRVNRILTQADRRLNEFELETRPDSSRRAARLRELEADPPRYVRETIGRPPRLTHNKGHAAARLREWRRLAVAIEDHRNAHGITDELRPFRTSEVDSAQAQAREVLAERIARFRGERPGPSR